MNYFSFHPNKYKQTFNEIKCRKNKKKEEEKRPIKEAKLSTLFWPFVGPLFVLGICGIVSNPSPSQPIVSFLFWPILFWH
jgi:hypothetical protein